jgi:hypothetical protein
MATLEFTEYRFARAMYGALAQLPHGQEIATQQVAIGAASAPSDPFNERTQLIVVTADADCRIAIGAVDDAEALNADPYTRKLTADREYAFEVTAGQVIAVIEMEA